MLRGLADSQQKIRVQLAGANSRAEITRMAEDTLTYARVLAERPPLRRLLAEPGARTARTRVFPAVSARPPSSMPARCSMARRWWREPAQACRGRCCSPWPRGERFMAAPAGTEFSVVGATAKLPAQYSSFSVMVVHLLDDQVAEVLSEHSGLPVRIINYRAYDAGTEFTVAAFAGAHRRPVCRAAHRPARPVRLEFSHSVVDRRRHRVDRDHRAFRGNRSGGELRWSGD